MSTWNVVATVVVVWCALAGLVWGLVQVAKVTISSEPAEPVEDEMWVDPAGPFGWMSK